ncbi:CDP-diacylglycerol--serine O-phosphatidyltransferase [Elstera cyanobacteriorum]|uniref:CDP-diacylglycerol--serine O-phosphatidyltransferase n=1 Tax=Elstera cyanobacteriorum TaxID=2022747 RepID=UPI002353BE21|nr:CDP-diacylglycerol--serine O-phosphatidyltransferase [Elstera cyanobacteriorum]MCK6443536.1 CDP-diacylglycerol--serine O-phosphatidyltransferase [Elstera cyanobacteriorum]
MLRRRPTRQPRRLRAQSINRLIPNMVTLLALCSGLTAIRFALEGRWQATVVAIFLAAIFDGLDGRLARLMNATSKFGAELDSLSDFVCFGVVPPVVLFLWGLNDGGRVGWAVALFFTVCMALRLARFNTALEDSARPPWTYNFFTGVPAPAGAALALMPLIGYFEFQADVLKRPLLIGVWLLIVGGLMVSRIPTFSFKKVRIPNWLVLPFMLVAGGIAAGLATEPWLTLLAVQTLYLVSIPLSIRAARRLQRALDRSQPLPPEAKPD